MKEEARRVETQLECARTVQLQDDVWFWDRAVGFICEKGRGSSVRVLVYQNSGSAQTSAVEQGGGDDSAAIVDDRLLISGQADAVEDVTREVPRLPRVQTGRVEGKALTSTQEDATFCVRAAAAHAMLTVEGGEEPDDDISDIDSLYPGYAEKVAEIDADIRDRGLRELYKSDPVAFEGAFSKIGPSIKKLCGR